MTVPAADVALAACARRHGAELESADSDARQIFKLARLFQALWIGFFAFHAFALESFSDSFSALGVRIVGTFAALGPQKLPEYFFDRARQGDCRVVVLALEV